MNQQGTLDRLREELNIPFFDGKTEGKEHSEEEHQKFETDLQSHLRQHVQNVES